MRKRSRLLPCERSKPDQPSFSVRRASCGQCQSFGIGSSLGRAMVSRMNWASLEGPKTAARASRSSTANTAAATIRLR